MDKDKYTASYRMVEDSRTPEEYSGALTADGFEDALMGYGHQFSKDGHIVVAIYDVDAMYQVLMIRDRMTHEEAMEYVEYNVAGAYVAPNMPILMQRKENIGDY